MKQIQSLLYDKVIPRSFDENIHINQTGIYCIEIVASAKSWWQNMIAQRLFLLKDSLSITLDKNSIIPVQKKKKLLADDLWNGNILKGNEQTVFVIVSLESGSHLLSFIVHGKPFISSLKVYFLEDGEIKLNELKTQKKDRIPWITFLITEQVLLESLLITAQAGKQSSDDDDLQLKIDWKIIKNQELKSHKEWNWCGKTLHGSKKTFKQEFQKDKTPSRIDLVVDNEPHINELVLMVKKQSRIFTEKDVQSYQYRGTNGKEDYNRFHLEILDAVNEWNNIFNDAYPPPELLHPNLVKAMLYIESRMGYFESDSYPSYPDVMQVAHPNNPAIHTLNRDGWISPVTKKVAEEHEWKQGKIDYLNYGGTANGISAKESILWGTRWLYHLAQGITHDKKRYWKTWKEAVKLYNGGGNSNYVQEVYNIYTQGVDRRKNIIKLWGIGIFIFLILLGGGLGVYAHQNNGYFWLTFDESQEEGVEYVLTLNEGRGMMIKKTPITARYRNGGNIYDIRKDDRVSFFSKDISNDGYEHPEIIVEGVSEYAVTVYVLQKIDGEWKLIPTIGEYGGIDLAPAFHGHDVSFINIDGQGWQEAKSSFHFKYSNAQDEVWHTWYQYNPLVKAFVFIKKNKVSVVDENDYSSDVRVDQIMLKEAPYYQW